jgi:hypothetical protein
LAFCSFFLLFLLSLFLNYFYFSDSGDLWSYWNDNMVFWTASWDPKWSISVRWLSASSISGLKNY